MFSQVSSWTTSSILFYRIRMEGWWHLQNNHVFEHVWSKQVTRPVRQSTAPEITKKGHSGAGWCSSLSEQMSFQLLLEAVQRQTVVIYRRRTSSINDFSRWIDFLMKLFKTSNMEMCCKLLPNTVWMRVAQYLVETAISEIHCCVVMLCLTCFNFAAFS